MTYAAKKDQVLKSVDSLTDEAAATVTSATDTVKREAAHLQDTVTKGAAELGETVNAKLKAAGVDTEHMVTAAKEQATELQRMLGDELKAHPWRALGAAAALGLVVGLLSAR